MYVCRHVPTGVSVKCQQSRSQAANRKIAREEIALRVDALLKNGKSVLESKRNKARNRRSEETYNATAGSEFGANLTTTDR